MLGEAREKLGKRASLLIGDASEMPYSPESFDLIVVTMALHEMPRAVRSGVLEELKRILKKEGRILLIDFHPGPIRFPKGWLTKILIVFFEISAGREHYKNYRDFLDQKGLPPLMTAHRLSVEKNKIVSGGNLGLFLLGKE